MQIIEDTVFVNAVADEWSGVIGWSCLIDRQPSAGPIAVPMFAEGPTEGLTEKASLFGKRRNPGAAAD